MYKRKLIEIEKQLEKIEDTISHAEVYVARGVNIEGKSWLHFGDWEGESGHPLWMKNFAIPAMKKGRARKEKSLKMIKIKAKDKELGRRRSKSMSDSQ